MGEPKKEEESDDKKSNLPRPITLKLVLPVVSFTLLAQMLTILLAIGYESGRVRIPPYEPFGSSVPGSVGNSLTLIATVFSFTFILVWLVRTKRINLIKRFITIFISFTSFFLTLLLSQVILPTLTGFAYVSQISLTLGLAAGILIGYSSLKPNAKRLGIVASLILSVEVATYLAIILRPPTLFILPVAFALYDLYAVFIGPLKTLITSGQSVLGPLAATLGELQIGLGDIAFYALLPAAGFILVGVSGAVITIITTNIGLLLTLRMLRNRPSFPGLPIPVLLGTVGLLLLA